MPSLVPDITLSGHQADLAFDEVPEPVFIPRASLPDDLLVRATRVVHSISLTAPDYRLVRLAVNAMSGIS